MSGKVKREQVYELFQTVEERETTFFDVNSNINLEYLSYDYDGIFETVEDWKKFAETVDHAGISYVIDKCVMNNGYANIEKLDYEKVVLKFDKPIFAKTGVKVEKGNKIDIISKISWLKVEVDYQWGWLSNIDIGMATSITIFCKILDFG